MAYNSRGYDAPKRPIEVTVASVVVFIGAAFLAWAWLEIVISGSFFGIPYASIDLMRAMYAYGVPWLVIIGVILGIGLQRLQSWARVTTIALSSFAILVDLYGILEVAKVAAKFDTPTFIKMALEIVLIVLLARPNVVATFEGGPAVEPAR